jgi:hypothetical protein
MLRDLALRFDVFAFTDGHSFNVTRDARSLYLSFLVVRHLLGQQYTRGMQQWPLEALFSAKAMTCR